MMASGTLCRPAMGPGVAAAGLSLLPEAPLGPSPTTGATINAPGSTVSRNGGFPTADLAVSFLHDPKVRRLRKTAGADAVLDYLDLILTGWGIGERVSAHDICPESAAAIRAAGLIDQEGCVPASTWDAWYGHAEGRRDALRRRWARSNERRRVGQ